MALALRTVSQPQMCCVDYPKGYHLSTYGDGAFSPPVVDAEPQVHSKTLGAHSGNLIRSEFNTENKSLFFF